MPSYPTLARLADLAADQWGLVTRRQAERAGISSATLDRLTADGSLLERLGHGVYRLSTAPMPDHAGLRAAWLQLAPDLPAWVRTAEQGVVSHRSAAAIYGLGHLTADRHEFTVTKRKQSRRSDVRIHHRKLDDNEWMKRGGLPVTLPSRTASDLLRDNEDPEAVAQVIAAAIRGLSDYPASFAQKLAPYGGQFGLHRGDGIAVLRWLLDLVGDPDTPRWMQEARATVGQARAKEDVQDEQDQGSRPRR